MQENVSIDDKKEIRLLLGPVHFPVFPNLLLLQCLAHIASERGHPPVGTDFIGGTFTTKTTKRTNTPTKYNL